MLLLDHPYSATGDGSYSVASDTTRDIDFERVTEGTSRLNQRMGSTQLTLRSRAEFARFFDGPDMVEPGVVPLAEWRAHADPPHTIPAYAGIGRKR